jgi:hypothetical protein
MVHSLGMRGEDAGDVRPRKVAGVPAGIDGQGNLYLARANHIQVLRKRPAAEK